MNAPTFSAELMAIPATIKGTAENDIIVPGLRWQDAVGLELWERKTRADTTPESSENRIESHATPIYMRFELTLV